jgi:hypothetical protein
MKMSPLVTIRKIDINRLIEAIQDATWVNVWYEFKQGHCAAAGRQPTVSGDGHAQMNFQATPQGITDPSDPIVNE